MSIKSILKKQKKEDAENFSTQVPQVSKAFLRFQVEHGVRAVISNQYQNNKDYPPNVLIDLICSFNFLSWRKISEEEKNKLNEELLKESGIVLPK